MTTTKTTTVLPFTRHRALWLSDVHLGSPGCKARRLVRFLRQNECAQLYLVGDIFDGWKMKTKFYWTADHTRVIKAILAKARRGTKVYYLTGNHDAFMRQLVKNKLRLGRIQVMHERVHETADGRRLLVQHGDQYDTVVNALPGLALAGDFAYESLLKASDWLARARQRVGLSSEWSPSAFAKQQVKGIVQYLSGFDDAVYYQCRRRRLDGVIFGHTHHAEVRHIRNGIVSHNCGDWVESCTALVEDAQGNIRILRAEPAPTVKTAVPRPAALRRHAAPPPPVRAPAVAYRARAQPQPQPQSTAA